MKTHFTILLLLACGLVSAQQYRQSVLNSTGGSAQFGYFQFEWSVGEGTLVDKMDDGNQKLTVSNGFLQPYILYPGYFSPPGSFDPGEVRIFPNPSIEYVEVNISTRHTGKLVLNIYNATGQLVLSREMAGNGVDIVERIPISNFAQGYYSLQIELTGEGGNISKKSVYKIIKIK
jgi:hypothetical protein